MKLNFSKEYKSVNKGGVIELSSFVVLTGPNGSGKTHLLEAIANKSVLIEGIAQPDDEVLFVRAGDLLPGDSSTVQPKAVEEPYDMLVSACDELIREGQSISDENEFINRGFEHLPSKRRQNLSVEQNIRTNKQRLNPKEISLQSALKRALRKSFSMGKRQVPRSDIRLLIRQEEIEQFYQIAIFKQSFSMVFLRYFDDRRNNKIQRLLRDIEGEKVEALSDEEFERLKGKPPWEIVNSTFFELGLPYEIDAPVSHENSFSAQLRNKNSGAVVSFTDLSSGELTLASLAVALYQQAASLNFPKLLLLDEPDAHLHPAMSQQLINVLKKVLLPEISIGLIFTTHSPTTCALSPEDSLYLMDPETKRPVPTDADTAISALCVGVPFLSIRKENERQVIVESDVDREIYTRIWALLQPRFQAAASVKALNFISSGSKSRSGNRDQAIKFCRAFRESGSTTTFALVDRDEKPCLEQAVITVGNGERYAIENFLLSPVLVVALLAHHFGDQWAPNLDALRVSSREIGELSETRQQELSNTFCKFLREHCEKKRQQTTIGNAHKAFDFVQDEPVSVFDLGENNVQLPKWYLEVRGHDLEDAIVEAFPQLNAYTKKGAGALMGSVVRHVISECPDRMPLEMYRSYEMLIES